MRFQTRPIVSAFVLSLALAACGGEAPEPAAEPEAEVADTGSDITGEEIEEAVPGVEAAYPEGDRPNTAGFDDDKNAEFAEPNDPEEERDE